LKETPLANGSLFEPSGKPIPWADIQAFLDQKLPENERIEYKAELNPRVPESIAAMANTRGGIILVGVEGDAQHKPILPTKCISIAHVKGGTLGNLCHARLQPLFVPLHQFVSLPNDQSRGVMLVQVVPDLAPIPIWVEEKGVLVRLADQNRPADLVTLRTLLGVADERLAPLRHQAEEDIGLALSSNAENRTYMIVGAMIQRRERKDRWTTLEIRALRQAIYSSVSSRRVQVGNDASTVLAESKNIDADTYLRISLSVTGVAVIVFGWRGDPFPIPAIIASLMVGVRMLLSKDIVEAYDPVAPMEVTLGVVNWPDKGLSIERLWGLSTPQPIGMLKGRSVSRTFPLSPDALPWTVVGPFLSYILGDAGFSDYERYLDQPPPFRALMDYLENTGLTLLG
jgi:hypothetical protein